MLNQGIRLLPFQRSAPSRPQKPARPRRDRAPSLLSKEDRLRDNVTAFLVGNARLEPNTSCWVESFMHRYCARMPTLTRTSTRSNTFPRCFQRWLTAHPIRGNGPRSVPEATIKRLEASQTQTPVSDQYSTVPLIIARQWHERPGCNKHGGGGGGCIRDGLSTHRQFESQNRKTRPHSSCSTRPCYRLLHMSKCAAS
jgi:hypothetical protein